MSKVLLENYGCELNKAEMNYIENTLTSLNVETTYDITEKKYDAVVINTCSVRKTAEERVLGRIALYNSIKKRNKKLLIIVTGCMAQRLGDELKKKYKGINYVISNNKKDTIPYIISSYFNTIIPELDEEDSVYQFHKNYTKKDDLNAYIPIMNGCNNFCSYCIVPYVRGREVSRDYKEIIEEIKNVDSNGTHVITLLGQNVNAYSFDNKNFNDLVKMIDNLNLNNIKSIRFESPYPTYFDDELIDTLSVSKYFSHHFHIPIQSGSTRVLKAMNRKYKREEALELFSRIRNKIKDATFSLDLMVGFPTETKAEFNETLSFVYKVNPHDAFMYYYNRREGTEADKYLTGFISENQALDRLDQLIAFQRANALKLKQQRIGLERLVCVRDISKKDKTEVLAFDINTLEGVVFKGDNYKKGDLVRVRFVDLVGYTYKGEVLT